MNEVFPRKWYQQHDRKFWGDGPWDGEPDREQWTDPVTKYPCLAIRSDIGAWAGYVGVYPDHPLFGQEDDQLPGRVNYWGHTDEVHFIEPWPDDPTVVVDENDPKESVLSVVRMPDYLWFFGFDFAHAGDIMPGIAGVIQRVSHLSVKHLDKVIQEKMPRTYADQLAERRKRTEPTYKTIAYTKETCAKLALALWTLSGKATMDSARLIACGC